MSGVCLLNADNAWSQVALRDILKHSFLPCLWRKAALCRCLACSLSQRAVSLLSPLPPPRRGGWAPRPRFQLGTWRPESGLETGLGYTAGSREQTLGFYLLFLLVLCAPSTPQPETSPTCGFLCRAALALCVGGETVFLLTLCVWGASCLGPCRWAGMHLGVQVFGSRSLVSLPVPVGLKQPHL